MSDTYDSEIEIFRNGLTTTLKVKSHPYDLVELTMKKLLVDEDGREIVNNGYTTFFTPREFKHFLQPLVNDLKVRFDNADNIQE